MDLEEENDYIEEEYCVYIDFENSLTSIETNDPSLDVKIIGIDSESPIVEVNGKIFKGSYDYAYCTNVLFEEEQNEQILDPVYEKVHEKYFRLLGKTNKKLTMKRIFLESIIKDEKKQTDECDIKSGQDQLDKEQNETLEELKTRLEVNTTYQDALNLLLSPGREPPRIIEENPIIISTLESKPNIPNFENSAEMYEYVEDCDDEYKDPDYDPTKDDSCLKEKIENIYF